jgi:DNA mismatch repair protein MutL
VPAAEIDPTVHPAKTEVRLARQAEVAEVLARTVREALTAAPAQLDASADFTLIGGQPRLALRPKRVREAPADSWPSASEPGPAPGIPISELRVVAQVQGALILTEGPGGLYLVDQHRAHERAIFERLLRRDHEPEANAQALLDPILVELSRAQAARLDERLAELERLGFAVERFGEHDFLVRAIPAAVANGEPPDLSQVLDEAAAEGESWRQRLQISLSCRAAVRRNQPLDVQQMQGLVSDLAETSVPAACPHGSPLVLHVGRDFLQRQFGW